MAKHLSNFVNEYHLYVLIKALGILFQKHPKVPCFLIILIDDFWFSPYNNKKTFLN